MGLENSLKNITELRTVFYFRRSANNTSSNIYQGMAVILKRRVQIHARIVRAYFNVAKNQLKIKKAGLNSLLF